MSQLNADKCYIFTDTETTGLDINFSQIIQIGSILTDESLHQENSLLTIVTEKTLIINNTCLN